MKERLLVMNGSRILEVAVGGAWSSQKVDRAGALKPGIYNLFAAQDADRKKVHEGCIIHTDANSVYQACGKGLVRHDRIAFDKVPDIGAVKSIRYSNGRAFVTVEAPKLTRGRSL